MKKVFLKYNQISHLPLDYQQRVSDLADFYQQLPYDHTYKIAECTDLDQGFCDLKEYNPDWVVVVAYGHCTQDRGMYDDLIRQCQDQNIKLMGHILNFPDQYPHLHPQLVVVDYQYWRTHGCPTWNYSGESSNFTSAGFAASADTFHDEYTPYYIKPYGLDDYTVNEMQVGANVIRKYLEQGITIHNIPQQQRDRKWHLYPDQDWEQFNSFLQGGEYNGTNNQAQMQYCSLVNHLSTQVRKQYYVLNTEALTSIPANVTIDHYAGVASGIKLMCTMVKNGFTDSTAVTIFDFSPIALEFQQYLIKNWDGNFDNYQVTCRAFEDLTPGNYPCLPSGPWENTYNHVLQELKLSKDEFELQWQRYCKLNHDFKLINLYDPFDQQRLAEACTKHQQTYLWISNAFYMEYSLVKVGKNNLKEIRQGLLDALSKTNTVLDTNDHWHQGLITFNN